MASVEGDELGPAHWEGVVPAQPQPVEGAARILLGPEDAEKVLDAARGSPNRAEKQVLADLGEVRNLNAEDLEQVGQMDVG